METIMKFIVVVGVLASLPSSVFSDDQNQDMNLLGYWEIVSVENCSQQINEDFDINAHIKKSVRFLSEGVAWETKGKKETGTCKIKKTDKNNIIDIKFNDSLAEVHGIYKIEGDTLKLNVGLKRPENFDLKANSPSTLWTLKRVKSN